MLVCLCYDKEIFMFVLLVLGVLVVELLYVFVDIVIVGYFGMM